VEKLIEDEKLTHEPEILSKESLTNDNSKWVGLYKITYLDQNGKKRFWESVERKTRTTNEIDAVGIVPLLKSKDSNTTKTILCIQFRLVEKDEAPEQAALRELYEETGYKGKAITNVSTSMFNDAGITNTNMKLVFIEVDLDDEINKNPIPKLEEDEFINILLVDLKDLYSTLQEAIDNFNYKFALQQCNKILKKQPEALIVKTLKGLVLERTGKQDEALKLCEQVKEKNPIDEAVLQALTLVYLSMGKNEEIVKIYENATQKNPNNEELGNHWFMAMVRSSNYKGQQHAALKLHKTFNSNKYLFWAIMSLVLQSENIQPNQINIFMPLAERMMLKAVNEGKVQNTEEVLDVLEGDLGQRCKDDIEIIRIKNELFIKTENWMKSNEMSKEILSKTNIDDWIAYKTFLDSHLKLIEEQKNNDKCTDSLTLSDAREFIYSLQKKDSESSVPKRGPFLAELELEHLISKKENSGELAKVMIDMLVNYFRKFGSKACCFEDLQPYLKNISKVSATMIIGEFKTTLIDSHDEKESIKNIQINVNICKFERYFGLLLDLSESELITYINKLWKLYQDSLKFGTNLPETEKQHGDDFAILASHALIDLYLKYPEKIIYLLQAIFLLESALEKSKNNFQFKLLLIRLYQNIGVFQRPLELYRLMDIKHVQLDTLSHYILARCLSFGFYEEANLLYVDTLSIYKNNELKTPEMVIHAYKFSTFSKIQEFIEFQKRLENSIQKAIVDREKVRLENIIVGPKDLNKRIGELNILDLKFDDSYCKSLYDNRDFSVMINCNPPDQKSIEELIRSSPNNDIIYLKVFTIIPHDLSTLVKELEDILKNDHKIESVEIQLSNLIIKLSNLYLGLKNLLSGQKELNQQVTLKIEELTSQVNELLTNKEKVSIEKSLSRNINKYSSTLEIQSLQNFTSERIREKLQSFQSKLNNLKTELKGDKVQKLLFSTVIKNENSNDNILEFCLDKKNEPFIKSVLSRIGTSWSTSIQNIIKELELKIKSC
ncbi:19699_t:CDS:10, partial [Entrophospora sp. SA101]